MPDDCCKNSKPSNLDFNLEGLICYCFKKSKLQLHNAVKEGKEVDFIESVKAKMKDPGCFCESANPSGKCCLADIQIFIKQTKESLG